MGRETLNPNPTIQADTSAESVGDPSVSPTKSQSVMETVNGSHEFLIEGYSLAKGMGPGKYISSQLFTVGGAQWAIIFYPDGQNPEDESAYVSLFVALISEGIEVRALFELTLVDQSGKGKHLIFGHFDRVPEKGPYVLNLPGASWGCERFFRKATLDTSDYLKNDCMKIKCRVGVVKSVLDRPRLDSIPVPDSDIAMHFGMLLEKQEGSDVVFYVDGEKFHAHKLVLAARSPVFRAFLYDEAGGEENEIVVKDMEPRVFKAMLHFIYRDTIAEDELSIASTSPVSSVSDTLAAKLLAASSKYGLERLRLMCESYLCKDMSVNTVASTLALAYRHHAMKLKAACLQFAAENLSAVMQSGEFMSLKENYPSMQSELLETIAAAGCKDEYNNGAESRRDAGDSDGQRLRTQT